MEWFTVDKAGLAKLLERKGKAFVLFELIQNCWDTEAGNVSVDLKPIPHRPYCELVVTDDDPEGFKNLSHAFTLFAESEKKGDPTKRGRFNLGEKLVLALCEEATIISTKGSVRFDSSGRHAVRLQSQVGSTFTGRVRMTRPEFEEACRAVRTLIPPSGKQTLFNGEPLPEREQKEAFVTTLATEVADEEGVLRRTARKTLVSLYEVLHGETPHLYEMGIPVVELTGGEPWHINVHQKIPLNADRDNVTPAYLRDLRTEVLNHMHMFVDGEDAAARLWVRDAIADENAKPEAIEKVVTEAFGKDSVIFDPSDPQANKAAMAAGHTVIPGGALSKEAWRNIRANKIRQPSGKVFPTHAEETAETVVIPLDEWTPGMSRVADLVQKLGRLLLDCEIEVGVISAPAANVAATWTNRRVTFNVGVLKEKWFEDCPSERHVDLILHEFGHHFESDHLSEKYYRALTRLAAKLAFLVSADNSVLRLP